MLAMACGCSKEKMDEMVNTVKEQAKTISESAAVVDVLPATGRAEVKLSPPVAMTVAYVRLYSVGDGRPGVVQFTSYDPDKGPNTFPALLVRAMTSATSLDGLAGQTLNAKVFFQAQSSGPVLSTGESGVLQATVSPLDPNVKTINASIAAGSLVDSSGKAVPFGGITVEGVQP